MLYNYLFCKEPTQEPYMEKNGCWFFRGFFVESRDCKEPFKTHLRVLLGDEKFMQ